MSRETRGGQTLSPRVWALLEDAAREVGVRYAVVQGSWSTSVGASAGTHSGGGAFDLRSRDYSRAQSLAMVTALRRRNVCAWWRTPEFGWPASAGGPHIHGIVRDEPGLSPAAARQIADYDRGLNGLASHGRDPFPRPPQSPFTPGGPPPPAPEVPDVTPAEAQAMIDRALAGISPRLDALATADAAAARQIDAVRLDALTARQTAAAARLESAEALRTAAAADERAGLALYTASGGATYADLDAGEWAEAAAYRDLPRLARP